MKVSYHWLQELAPGIDLTPEEAMERLALRGAPVEEATDLAAGLRDVTVGRVLEAVPHPGADRLTLCRVAGPDGEVPVVCGAPEVRVGGFYPFAPVGSTLPGGFKIGRRKIRGEHSEGMLCSERELGLGTDHAGIMLLSGSAGSDAVAGPGSDGPDGSDNLACDLEPGASFVEAMGLDDICFDVEVTPNRGDLLSHVGVARELHQSGHAAVSLPPFSAAGPRTDARNAAEPSHPPSSIARGASEAASADVTVRIEDPELCPRYLAALVRGVAVGPSPLWLANRLRAVGARPVNNVVDATNYVMLELGQPLHAFDLARLGGSVVVGRARPGESMVTLDGERRALSTEMLTIRDAERPVAVAGVMGGANSEVSANTADVLLECALFEPRQVRAARRALGMSTDASYRFERGVDPEAMETAVLRAASLIATVAGGSLDGPVVDACPIPWEAPVVGLRPSRVRRVLGVGFEPDEIAGLLAPLGYAMEERDEEDSLRFRVPGHRSWDTLREIDLIEEVARTHGYDSFPETLRPYRPGTVPDHPLFRLEDALRAALAADGISEAQTPALGPEADGDVAVLNPMSAQESRLRRDLLSGLLTHVERNMARGTGDVRLFELGTAFAPAPARAPDSSAPAAPDSSAPAAPELPAPAPESPAPAPAAPVESPRVAVVLTGRREPVHWSGAGARYEVHDAARALELVAREAYPGAQVEPGEGEDPRFAPGRWYRLTEKSGQVVGAAGQLRPAKLDLPPWAGAVIGAEVVLPAAPEPPTDVVARELPDQPASTRDVAMLVPLSTPAGAVLEAIRGAKAAVLEDAQVFDVYEGDDLPAGTRSVAFRLRFRAARRTLTDAQVDQAFRRVLRKVKEATGVEPRVS